MLDADEIHSYSIKDMTILEERKNLIRKALAEYKGDSSIIYKLIKIVPEFFDQMVVELQFFHI